MAILKVSYDMTNRNTGVYDSFAQDVRVLRDNDNILVEESDIRASLIGDSLAIANAIQCLDRYAL